MFQRSELAQAFLSKRQTLLEKNYSKEPDLRRPGIYCTVSHAGGRLQEAGNTFLDWRVELVEIWMKGEMRNEWVAGIPHLRWVEYNLHAAALGPYSLFGTLEGKHLVATIPEMVSLMVPACGLVEILMAP